uniref:Reverse transcriptase zinc-binding domain-containing protein n=1 Tax=Setaria viridis TaxID=4556 RepID=A0A4U6UVF6_SETVI|nr:hypothetical protein SEVIR_4G091900v2 [Setaria viridis]
MRSDDLCPFCSEREDCFHLFISCLRSESFWSFLRLDLRTLSPANGVEQLWTANPVQEQIQKVRTTVLTCVLWNIWKCRKWMKPTFSSPFGWTYKLAEKLKRMICCERKILFGG